MKIIVLAGLVSIEKINLAAELAQYFDKAGLSVQLLDNIARLAMDAELFAMPVKRLTGDILPELGRILDEASSDIVLLAISEETNPEALFETLEELRELRPDWDIFNLALIDLRTCDCFPNLREALEMTADLSILLPYDLDEVIAYVAA